MKLDKTHLDQFENINPPMCNALTIPVETTRPLADISIYVCSSMFNQKTTRQDVLDVAVALRIVDSETHNALIHAVDMLMHVPGGHQHTCDLLRALAEGV